MTHTNGWVNIWTVARGIHGDLKQNPYHKENKAKYHEYGGRATIS